MRTTPSKKTAKVVLERREAVPCIVGYLNSSLRDLESVDYPIKGSFDRDALSRSLEQDLPRSDCEGCREFITDVVTLCEQFFNTTESKHVRFQIEKINTDKCRLFHTDNMRQRLLCTYVGPGTEWLDHSNANRKGLGKGCNKRIVKDFSKVNKAQPFEVILLTGAKSRSGLAVVHRSPPVQHELLTRVVLKIDERDKEAA